MRMDDKSKNDGLTLGLRTLNSIAKKLKAKRTAAGALTLASPEVRNRPLHPDRTAALTSRTNGPPMSRSTSSPAADPLYLAGALRARL